MRKRRRRSTLAERVEDAEYRDDPGPTPETKAKVRPDPIDALYGTGLIDSRQKGSAEEIREIYHAVVSRLFASPGFEASVDGGARPTRHPLDGMPADIRRRYLKRYIPWTKEIGPMLEIVIDAIVDGRHPERGRLCWALDKWPTR